MHQAGHPGGTHSDPEQWKPEHGKSPHKKSDSDSEGSSSDDDKSKSKGKKAASKPVTFDDIAIAGYGGMPPLGQMNASTAPPQPSPSGQAPDVKFGELSALDEATCRDAVLHFAAENCCYGKAPAKEMTFCKLTSHTALHYTLETFGESRSTGFKVEPFRGGSVDGPENGAAPPPWAILCEPGSLFKDQVKLIEVPHTSVIKNCHQCESQGWVKCARCKGKGKVKCKMCHGKGTREAFDADGNTYEADCPFCKKGKISCHKCGGDGKITCPTCQGFRQVRCFIEVKVEFKNHMNDYILEQTDLPDKLVKTVSGKPIFEQTLPQVWPITTYPMQEVNSNSQSLINSHRSNFNNERKIMQRQILRAVPVMEVVWDWKDTKDRRLWVYGNEHKVHCPDYPQRCCWGCQLL